MEQTTIAASYSWT